MFTCNICRFTDCESCTRPISPNPASMEAGEYGLTRGTCFVAGRLVVVAVAELLWISWCVLDAAGFRGGGFPFFFFERTRPAASMRPPCLIYLSTCNEAVFCLQTKKLLHTGVRTGCHLVINVFPSVCVCETFVIFTDCESCTRPISTNSGSMEAGEYGLTRGTCFVA